jgi:UDP-N-acetylglucosamine 4,6-dehydratase/UDP-glucose 4-epimerase
MDIKNKILIDGGDGHIGSELVKRLIGLGCVNLMVLSKNEETLLKLKERFPVVETVVGDIGSKMTCERVCYGVDGIFHLAAFKHVNLAENNVKECIQSNINGSMNLLDCTVWYKPQFILGVSTDKAGQPSGVYGMTKYLMERMFAEYERFNKDTEYRLVRFGNVWGSTGSLSTIWLPKMKKGEEITVTDPGATRFFWTVEEAVDLIFSCIEKSKDSTPLIPTMKAVSLQTIIDACHEVYGDFPVKVIGLKEGENLHEILNDKKDSSMSEQYTKEEFINKFLEK